MVDTISNTSESSFAQYPFISGIVLALGSVFAITASLLLRCGKDSKQNDSLLDSSEHKTMLSSNGVIEKFIELDITTDKLHVKHGNN